MSCLFGIGTAAYGFVHFLPQVIKSLGLSALQTGFVLAMPDVCGTLGMVIWGHFSERQADRRWNVSATLFVCGFGLLGIGLFSSSGWWLIAMAMVSVGINASHPMFWALPSTFLTGTAAAAIALMIWLAPLAGLSGR